MVRAESTVDTSIPHLLEVVVKAAVIRVTQMNERRCKEAVAKVVQLLMISGKAGIGANKIPASQCHRLIKPVVVSNLMIGASLCTVCLHPRCKAAVVKAVPLPIVVERLPINGIVVVPSITVVVVTVLHHR